MNGEKSRSMGIAVMVMLLGARPGSLALFSFHQTRGVETRLRSRGGRNGRLSFLVTIAIANLQHGTLTMAHPL